MEVLPMKTAETWRDPFDEMSEEEFDAHVEESVTVALLDGAGGVVAGPLYFSTTPYDGVVYRDATGYYGNLPTTGAGAGSYLLRVRFDSPTLIGDLLLNVDLS